MACSAVPGRLFVVVTRGGSALLANAAGRDIDALPPIWTGPQPIGCRPGGPRHRHRHGATPTWTARAALVAGRHPVAEIPIGVPADDRHTAIVAGPANIALIADPSPSCPDPHTRGAVEGGGMDSSATAWRAQVVPGVSGVG